MGVVPQVLEDGFCGWRVEHALGMQMHAKVVLILASRCPVANDRGTAVWTRRGSHSERLKRYLDFNNPE